MADPSAPPSAEGAGSTGVNPGEGAQPPANDVNKPLAVVEASPTPASKVDPEALKGSWTGALLLSIFASTIGGSFQFGYHIGCINVPSKVMKMFFIESHYSMFANEKTFAAISRFEWAFAVALFAVGGVIGGLASGWLADKFGRKGAMLVNNVIALIATFFLTIAFYVNVYHLIHVGRIFVGITAGASSGLVPMYLTEISPINLRGSIGSVNQLLVTVSILVSQIVGLPQLLGTEDLWPLVFAFSAIPVLVQVCTMPFCPESPKYSLIVKGFVDQAQVDLKKLRGKEDVSAEMETMREEAAALAAVEKVSLPGLFRGALFWPMFIAIMMMLAQQFSGINVAMFFSTIIFESCGLGKNAIYATLGMGGLNVFMTIVSVYLVDCPKCGRRMLLLIGLAGMLVASVLLVISIKIYNSNKQQNAGMAYFSMTCVFLFVVFFATGPGSIPWFFVSELFDSGARGGANSIAAMTNWAANFAVGVTFEFLMSILMENAFFIFSGFLGFFIVFVFIYVPETKGRSVADINEEFKRGKTIFARQGAGYAPVPVVPN